MADIEKQPTQAPAILPVEDQPYDSSESPSLGSESGMNKRNSREKGDPVAEATLAHELAEDNLEVSSTFSVLLLPSSSPTFRLVRLPPLEVFPAVKLMTLDTLSSMLQYRSTIERLGGRWNGRSGGKSRFPSGLSW